MISIPSIILPSIRSPGARLFLGMAIGDAYGARFENKTRGSISLSGEEGIYRDRNRYTDDTQMAIGVAELLISDEQFTRDNLARSLLTAYRRDPRTGYSSLTRKMLEESPDGPAFLNYLSGPEISERKSDGAAMRALPIGFLPDRNEVIRSATLSSSITHGHPDSVSATIGIALIAHDRYYTGRKFPDIIRTLPLHIPSLTSDARKYLIRVIESGWDPDLMLGEYSRYGVPYTESIILLGAVIAILAEFGEDPNRALMEAVKLGGDTDTTACIVLAAALIYPGSDTIPMTLISELEDGPYGLHYLIHLGDQVSARFPIKTLSETTSP